MHIFIVYIPSFLNDIFDHFNDKVRTNDDS